MFNVRDTKNISNITYKRVYQEQLKPKVHNLINTELKQNL